MNIQMQIGGVFVMLLLIYFYKRQGNLGLYIGKLFSSALYVTLVSLVLDILSVVLIVHSDKLPLWLVKAECKMYLVSLLCTGYMALAYANADIRHLAKADAFSVRLSRFAMVLSVFVFISPIEIYYDGKNTVYTSDLACMLTYAGALVAVLTTMIKLALQGKHMNPKRRNAIMLWMIIWIGAALTQFVFSQLLLVGFASALGMMILFFELENPEIYLDKTTGFFNSSSFGEVVKQRFRLNKNIYAMMISLTTPQEKNITYERMEEALAEIVQFLWEMPAEWKFRTDDREFTLVFEDAESLDKTKQLVMERFQEGWSVPGVDEQEEQIMIRPHYLIVPSGNIARNAEELLDYFRYFRLSAAEVADSTTQTLNDTALADWREHDEVLATVVRAIRENRVEVFFQPIYSSVHKKFVSAEALARIRLEDGSIMSPGVFIPIAEETGLIATIGEMVFEQTCRFIKEKKIEQFGLEYIEVNLSVVQCENETLADEYIRIMQKYELPPDRINLEITESAAIRKKSVLLANMRKLIDYGVSFSLDDFGNGQSNLNWIVDMPVDIVKFDYDMTKAYFTTQRAQFVLQAAANMIHEMKLKIVAEGVETEEQFEVFDKLGIDYFQGYHFSRPLEAGKFYEFVREKNQSA